MSKDEMREILTEQLNRFRTWTYAQLAERVEQDRRDKECLEHIEGIAADGTAYQIEFQAFWDDRPGGAIRVHGSFSAEPQKPFLGFLPLYSSDVDESFLLDPAAHFLGEKEGDEN